MLEKKMGMIRGVGTEENDESPPPKKIKIEKAGAKAPIKKLGATPLKSQVMAETKKATPHKMKEKETPESRYHDIVDEYCKDLYEKTFWALKQEEVVQLAFFLDLIPKNLETAYHKFRIVSKFTDTTELIALKLFAEAVEKKKDE